MFGPSKHRAHVFFFLFLRKAAWVVRKNIVPGGIRRHEFGLGSVPTIPHLTFS